MTEPQETHTWEPCSAGVSVEVEVADVYLHGHQVDEIIIESLQDNWRTLKQRIRKRIRNISPHSKWSLIGMAVKLYYVCYYNNKKRKAII